jgi:glycine cleavage system H protein
MTDLPENLKYAKTHEWASLQADDIIRVGITDFAQSELGDLVFVELPEVGRVVKQGEQCAVVESVKTASDLYSPVSGEIVAVNEDVADQPELVNEEAFQTWLFAIKAESTSELDQLLDAAAYDAMTEDS